MTGEITEITGETTEMTGETTEITGETTEITGKTEITGETTEITGETTEITGETTEITGETTEVTGETTEIIGETQTYQIRRKEMLYLTTHSTHFIYGYMASDIYVKNYSDSERGNHGLLFPVSSKGSFICTIPQTGQHIPWSLLHQSWSTGWNEKYIK